jgi:uncharacterized protein (TIGR00369 family)
MSDPPVAAPFSAEAVRSMTGLELFHAVRDGRLPIAPMAELMNMRFAAVEASKVAFTGRPGPQHCNPLGTVHGGYAATLLDSAMGCAVHTTLGAGVGYTTPEFKINLVRALTSDAGEVRVDGWVVHRGRSIATAEGKLVDAAGKLVAHGSTTCMIFGG